MFEHFKEELLSFEKFVFRLIRYFLIATALLTFSLVPGVIGFHWLGDLTTKESLINSLSVLGTIDPPYQLQTESGQIFTAIYGLFVETVFLLSLAILLAPVFIEYFISSILIQNKQYRKGGFCIERMPNNTLVGTLLCGAARALQL